MYLFVTIAATLALGTLLVAPASADLGSLMKDTGLHCGGPNDQGVYDLAFDGDNVPTIQVAVAVLGEGAFQSVNIFSRVVKVDDASKWDQAAFPWLLERQGELNSGCFILGDQARQLVFLARVPLAGLDGPTLKEYINFTALVVDDTYPKVKAYVKN
jgi:hypothetical protein